MHYLNMKLLVLINGKILSLERQILKVKGKITYSSSFL